MTERVTAEQERWASAESPQRQVLDHAFKEGPWEEALRGALAAGDSAGLDELLESLCAYYFSTRVGVDDTEELQQLEHTLRGLIAHEPADAISKAANYKAGVLADRLSTLSHVTRHAMPFPERGAVVDVAVAATVLRGETVALTATNFYDVKDSQLHAAGGYIAAVFGNGGTDATNAEQIRVMQQHVSRADHAPLRYVDSQALREVLSALEAHHARWTATKPEGIHTPAALFMGELLGSNGHRPRSLREIIAVDVPPADADAVEAELLAYLDSFFSEYGAGQPSWHLLPELLGRLKDAPEGLGEWIRAAAGNEDNTRLTLEKLLEWYKRAPGEYHMPEAEQLLAAVLAGEEVDMSQAGPAIESIVVLFTTSSKTVGEAAGRDAQSRSAAARVEDTDQADSGDEVVLPSGTTEDVAAQGGDDAGEEVVIEDAPETPPAFEAVRPASAATAMGRVAAVRRHTAAPATQPRRAPVVIDDRVMQAQADSLLKQAARRATPAPVTPARAEVASDTLPREHPNANIALDGRLGALSSTQVIEGLARVVGITNPNQIDALISHLTGPGMSARPRALEYYRDTFHDALDTFHRNQHEPTTQSRMYQLTRGVVSSLLGAGSEPARSLDTILAENQAVRLQPNLKDHMPQAVMRMLYGVFETSLRGNNAREAAILERLRASAAAAA